MPKDAHTLAAHHHEKAAHSHRAAAEQSKKGDHAACALEAATAVAHSARADEATKNAQEKSAQRLKSATLTL